MLSSARGPHVRTGIGLATAIHFARLGHDVYAGVRNPATATELARAIESEKLPITPVRLDVDDAGSVKHAVGEVLEGAGRARALFETNYFGAIRMSQAVLPGMRER